MPLWSTNMARNEKYWYFRLRKADIYDVDVQQIKQVPVLGYIIFTIYIELCALAIDRGGYIKIDKTSSERGYAAQVALLLGETEQNTADALSYLKNKGFVEIIYGDDAIMLSIPIVEGNIGKSSLEADRIRALQHRQKNDALSLNAPEETRRDTIAYGCFENVYLTSGEYERLKLLTIDADQIIDVISVCHKRQNPESLEDYSECLKYARENKKLSEDGMREVALLEPLDGI